MLGKYKTYGECGRMTLRISWTSLRTFEECRQKSYLKRQGRWNKIQDTRVFFPGTVVDRVVRDWLQNDKDHTLGIMPEMVSSIIDREQEVIAAEGSVMKWKDADDRRRVEADCREAVEKIEPALLKYVTPFEYWADYRFESTVNFPHPGGGVEAVILNGIMDIRVKDSKDRYWIWDVKMTRDSSYYKKVAGQLSFYDLATDLEVGFPPIRSGLLQPLANPPVKPIPITDQTRSELLARLATMAYAVWSDDKTPRADSTICSFCDAKHGCEKYSKVPGGRVNLLNKGV